MMHRTQVALDSEQHRRAKRRASELGVSLAEYVRRLLAQDLGSRRSASNQSAIFDLGSSGGSDVTRRKDRYIGEAAAAESTARDPVG